MRSFLIIFLSTCLLLTSACTDDKPAFSFKATDITGARFGNALSLHDAKTGEARTLESYKGKVLVLFFGYMFCPDYCPTTMATLATALKKMTLENAARIQVAMVTVDPARDTPELLKQYVAAFDSSFVGLYGNDEQTAAAAREFKIIYQKAQIKSDSQYLMDHSTQMYAVDPQGRIRLMIRHELGADAIAEDLTALAK